ncbi:MAG: type II toxin-antitoxin system HicB family antitoxin [Candidatus Brocadiaceae bacterium]
MKQFKLIIEKHPDGFVAYPLGLNGIVVGQGETFEAAFSDVKSAIRYHIENFGDAVFDVDSSVLEVFVAEATIED